jgi:hypothetical protein
MGANQFVNLKTQVLQRLERTKTIVLTTLYG